MKRCVIVLGGEISDYKSAKRLLEEGDWFIFCDSGLYHEAKLGVKADLAIGDFDSHSRPDGVETVVLPREKDDTDSYAGVKEGIRRGFRDFLILGALGGRVDHELANIYLLDYLDAHSCTGMIADGNTVIRLVSDGEVRVRKGCRYFSLLALFGRAVGVNIRGAEYNLENAVIEPSYQYGVSNEVALDEAVVSVKKGKLLLVETGDTCDNGL